MGLWQRPSLCWCGTQMWCRGHWFRSVYQQHPTRTRVSGLKLGFVAISLGDFLPLKRLGLDGKKRNKNVKKASRIFRFFFGILRPFFSIFPPMRWGFILVGVFVCQNLEGLSGDEQPHPIFLGKTLGNNHNEADHSWHILAFQCIFCMISAVWIRFFIVCYLGKKHCWKTRVSSHGFALSEFTWGWFQDKQSSTRWWFQIFFFHPENLGKMNPIWRIFFKVGWSHQPE